MSKPIYEEKPELFDGQDCRDTPYRDPRESPSFEYLPDDLKDALMAAKPADQALSAPTDT